MAFQSIVGAKLVQAAIPAVYTAIYIAPPNSRVYLKDIDMCNTAASPINVYLHIVGNSSSPSTGNALFYSIAIPGYTTVQWTGSQILNSADILYVKGSTAGCTINITGGIAT